MRWQNVPIHKEMGIDHFYSELVATETNRLDCLAAAHKTQTD